MTIQGGIGMLIFLAGLQNVPQELYDASKIDGAKSLQTLFSVTLPMLTPLHTFQPADQPDRRVSILRRPPC